MQCEDEENEVLHLKFFNHISVKQKLALMLMMPIIALLFFVAIKIVEKAHSLEELHALQGFASLAVKIDALTHEIQKERALSSGFIDSQGERFQAKLFEQRLKTNEKIENFKSSMNEFKVEEFGPQFQRTLDFAMDQLDLISEYREEGDAVLLSVYEMIDHYTDVNNALFLVMEHLKKLSPNAKISNLLAAYINFLRGKDKESIERALLNNAVAHGRFVGDGFQRFIRSNADRDSYYHVFFAFATTQEKEWYATIVKGEVVDEVARIRQRVFDNDNKGSLGIDPDHWYKVAKEKNALLKDVEENMSKSLLVETERLQSEGRATLILVSFMGFSVVFISMGLAYLISRRILKSIADLKEATSMMASGAPGFHLTKDSNDEIGDLADAFNQMVESSNKVIQQANTIARGDYSAEIAPRSDQDALGLALSQMTESLRRASEENERERWLKTGQAELSDRMRGEQALPTLSKNIVTYLAKYLGAPVGLIYLADSDGTLHLTGSYAYTRRKHLATEIKPGEGLVGQAALEKECILISEVPEDYIFINSGLGKTVPRNILVLPVLLDGHVKGILEIGSIQPFLNVQLDLLNLVAENIAITINSAQDRGKMAELLSETQRQSEQLHQQQEELKATNEELHEQTQALKQSGEELKCQSDELQASNEELEEKSEYLTKQKADIEKKNAEIQIAKQELEEKAGDLELASQYKSEFLANMSHELRTPLNSLLILAKSLVNNDEGNLTDDQIESAKIIHGGGIDLLILINDILDLSKVEAGQMNIHMEEVELHSFINGLQRQFNPIAKDKGIAFEVETPPGVPITIQTDEQRTEQILKNFLSNAFKFTQTGSVKIRVHVPETDVQFHHDGLTHEKVVAFSVTDTGIGIPEEKQKAIFKAFQQADGSTCRNYGGTGLGLTISRELARLLGGEIQLKSRQGEGSTFTLFLPADSQLGATEHGSSKLGLWMHSSSEAKSTPGMGNGRSHDRGHAPPLLPFLPDDRGEIHEGEKSTLIIEDDINFAKVLMDIIRKKGYKCLAAGDGASGLQLAAAFKPSAIILDLGLPDIDGHQVLNQLKHHHDTRHIPVHILSGRDDVSEFLKMGAVGHLTKPVSSEDIDGAFAKIEAFLQAEIRDLLVVEDDEASLKAMTQLIKNKGIDVTVSTTGREAYDILRATKVECLIIDLDLPDMSGFELLRTISEDASITMPPVIVYTARDLTREEDTQLREYAASIVIKGADSPERLLDEISLFLHRVGSSLPTIQQGITRVLHDADKMLRDRKVLLVDDDMRNTFALSKMLRKEGMKVVIADNGRLALEKLDSEPDIELVIMDIMMPVMDGYETMRRIRIQKQWEALPMIALTAKAMPEEQVKCIEAGANDYMTKPVDLEKLYSLMRVWLFTTA